MLKRQKKISKRKSAKRKNPETTELNDLVYDLVQIDYKYGSVFGTLEQLGSLGNSNYTIMELDKISKHISFIFYPKDVNKIILYKNKQTKARIELK